MNESWRLLYPFASHYLPLDGHRLHYVDEGSNGPPLLLVHGNPTWSFYWRNVVRGLRDAYRVVAVDHLGCGLSDKPQDYPYQLDQHIENLVALIDSLDLQQATLIAHDWGGAIGLGAASRRWDRFQNVILLNTAAFPPPYIPWRIRLCRIPALGTWAIRRHNLFARAATRLAMIHHARMTGDVKAGLLAPYDNWDHRVAIDRFVRDIPGSPAHPTWHRLAALEQELPRWADKPCQLIWGMRDWCFRPQCLDRFEQIWPHAEVLRLTDAGHYVVEDAHELVVPAMRSFLMRSYAARQPT